MAARGRIGRVVVAAALAVAGLGALASPAPAQVPGKNGKLVVFSRVVNGFGDVWVMKADGSGKLNLTKTPEVDERDAAMSPFGDFVVFARSGGLYHGRADGSQPPQPLAMFGESVWVSQLAFAPDGFRVLFRGAPSSSGSDGDIYVTGHHGGRITNLTNTPTDDETDPAWSSLSSTIAFVSDRTGNREVFLAKADGTAARNVSNSGAADESTPSFSPDGKKLAYVAPGNGGKPDVFVRNVSGTGDPQNLTNNAAADTRPSFSADGKKLLFASDRGGDSDVFLAGATAGAAATDLSKDSDDPRDDLAPDWGGIQELNCAIRPGFRVVFGTAGNDVLKGTAGPDQILGLGGNDKIDGRGGDDLLCGGPGRDKLIGSAGRDHLVGGANPDTLVGGNGRDTLEGGSGNDDLSGGAGEDNLAGGLGNDTLRGGPGKDVLSDRQGRNGIHQ